MFDDLTSNPENGSEKLQGNKRVEAPLGGAANIPVNLSPNPSPGLSQEGGVASVNKSLQPKSSEEFDQRIKSLEEKGKKRGIRFSRIGLLIGALIALAMMGVGYYLLTQVIGITEQAGISSDNISNIGRDNNGEENVNGFASLKITDEMRICAVDKDCVEVMGGCCGCEGGNIQTSINKDVEQEWSLKLAESCSNVECSENNVCSTGKAICDNMKCVFTTAGTEECISEGDSFFVSGDENVECCDLLQANPKIDLVDNECVEFFGELVCLNCGDGVCGAGENYCNCPVDCYMEIEEASSTDMIIEDESESIYEEGLCEGENCILDTDGDGLFDVDEEALGTDVNNIDTDGDNLSDGDELIYGTDLLNPDTDGDSYLDGDEVANGYNPLGEGLLN